MKVAATRSLALCRPRHCGLCRLASRPSDAPSLPLRSDHTTPRYKYTNGTLIVARDAEAESANRETALGRHKRAARERVIAMKVQKASPGKDAAQTTEASKKGQQITEVPKVGEWSETQW